MKQKLLVALFGLAAVLPAQAFSDNFDLNAVGLNAVPLGWTVSDGTVDIIGAGLFDYFPGNGSYIDLDGSTLNAGVLSRSAALTGGLTYTASFQLGGRIDGGANTVDVAFGTELASYTMADDDPFTTYTLQFTPTVSGSFSLSFADSGNDNYGALLDNINISAVPAPATAWLWLAGLSGLSLNGYRRRLHAAHA
jgi:hypothetical protein